jgi:hypothetical protein
MTRFTYLIVVAALLIAVLVGCGSHRRFTIDTGGNGSLFNVLTTPYDGESNVAVDTWVRVYWYGDQEPPPTFTFALRDGSDTRIPTYMHEGDVRFEWWFEPTADLDPDSRYKIEIISGDDKVVSYFYTAQAPIIVPFSAAHHGISPRISGPEQQHTIRAKP